MEIYVLDENFEILLLIDDFESLIWTERYDSAGDFEIYTAANETIIKEIQQGYYVKLTESDELMIIEEIQIETDYEKGNHLTISGRSVSILLDRRIVWNPVVLRDRLQSGLKELIQQNVISPTDEKRRIENFIFEDSEDEAITDLYLRAQYVGENLYETIQTVCQAYGIGFKVYLNAENKFVFKLYSGADRSYGQTDNLAVVFSPRFDNISQTKYLESDKTLKNVALVVGEFNEQAISVTVGSAEGAERRELYSDATDIQSEVDGEAITEDLFIQQLQQRGLEELSENQSSNAFEGDIEPNGTFIYGRDFFQGDILQVENAFGLQAKVRVTEFVRSQDSSGIQMVPTFTIIDNGMNASERKKYLAILHLLVKYGIVDDDFNEDVKELTIKDISKLENHAILDEQYDGIMSKSDIPSMIEELVDHIILDDDWPEEEE